MLSPAASLNQLPREQRAVVVSVDWDQLDAGEARRLREFGLDEGVDVELLHRALLRGGPVACRIGRMIIGLRGRVAGAIRVMPQAA